MVKTLYKPKVAVNSDLRRSKMGYEFDFYSDYWQLDGSVTINLNRLRPLDAETRSGFKLALGRYAEELAAKTTDSILGCFNAYCDATGETSVNVVGLTNWRAMLTNEAEAKLGALKSFLISWYEWGFPGVTGDVVDYLDSLRLKGIVKGKAVSGACPFSGPLSLQEQGALLDWAAGAFTESKITLTQYAMFLTLVFTGRRMVQIRSLRAIDLFAREDAKGREYVLKVPRVKQRGVDFREAFKVVPIVSDLYQVLRNQVASSQKYIENHLKISLPEKVKKQIPIFLETERLGEMKNLEQLIAELEERPDYLHMSERTAFDELREVAIENTAKSERTGDYINFTSRRFRYTKGTNLARRGIRGVSLAEALDHSSTQNIYVYVENTPETVSIIDATMAPILAPLAQAFSGVLIDSERNALRANDPHSRIKNSNNHSIGSCGTHAFCASGYRACYTCVKFQPWRDAPHAEVRDEILMERNRQVESGVSPNVIQSTDRLLLAAYSGPK